MPVKTTVRIIPGTLTDMCHYPTPYRGSTEALPYNFTETLLVGEGLAPPEARPINTE